jgi:hypothetical protein
VLVFIFSHLLFNFFFFFGGGVGGFALTLSCQLHVSKFLCTVGLGGYFSYKLCLYHVVVLSCFCSASSSERSLFMAHLLLFWACIECYFTVHIKRRESIFFKVFENHTNGGWVYV